MARIACASVVSWLVVIASAEASSARNAPPELAGLTSVWVSVSADKIPGLDSADLTRKVEEHLQSRGLKTEAARRSRTLFVRITYNEPQECRDVLYLRVAVSLSEQVRLARSPKLADVRATTWESSDVSSVPKGEAAAKAVTRTLSLVDSFAETVAYSTSVYAKRSTERP